MATRVLKRDGRTQQGHLCNPEPCEDRRSGPSGYAEEKDVTEATEGGN